MDIIDYIASDNYIIVNKSLIKTFGLNEAILMGELCTEYRYWKKENKLEDDMFYSTIDNIEENTGLTAYEQRQAIKSLENAGVLTTELKGIPAKKYFKLEIDTVVKILTTCHKEFLQQDVKKPHLNNNNNNNKTILSKDNIVGNFEFGSKKFKNKKVSMYNKCISLINDFTDDVELRDLLVKVLNLFLDNSKESGKTLYTNQFKGKLNTLKELSSESVKQRKIVQQTLDKGWNNFYELQSDKTIRNFAKDIEQLDAGLNERASKKGGTNGTQF